MKNFQVRIFTGLLLLAAGCGEESSFIDHSRGRTLSAGDQETGDGDTVEAGASSADGLADTAPAGPGGSGDDRPDSGSADMPDDAGRDMDTGSTDSEDRDWEEREEIFTNLLQLYRPVDVVIALDTSGSMSTEKARVEENTGLFIDGLQAAGLDLRIITIARGMNFSEDVESRIFRQVDRRVGSHNAIGVLGGFFLDHGMALRGDARTEVVIISDDNGEGDGNGAADFIKADSVDTRVHAIVGQVAGPDPDNGDCDVAHPGDEHMALARDTGGLILDVCDQDWSALLQKLSRHIAVNTPQTIHLGAVPGGQKPLEIFVNGERLIADEAGGPFTVKGETLFIPAGYGLKPGDKVMVRYWTKISSSFR